MAYNRFAYVTHNTIEKFRTNKVISMARARAGYDAHSMSAADVSAFVRDAREWNRKMVWAIKKLAQDK